MGPAAARVEGKTVLITGANAGIGRETARALAIRGARVLLAVRDLDKGRAAKEDILRDAPGAALHLVELDLADLGSVAAAARAVEEPIHVLVNNAGFHTARFERTRQGFESTFGVNHLGHFALTRALLPRLAPGARVVTVASEAHRGARVDWDDLQLERRFQGIRAYANSKLFNIWFARELARRHPELVSVAVHPGSVRTGWARGGESGLLRFGVALAAPFLLPPQKGASAPVHGATAQDVVSGGYYVRQRLREPSRLARDDAQAKRLWEESERLLSRA